MACKSKETSTLSDDSSDEDEPPKSNYTCCDLVNIVRKRTAMAETLASLERQLYAFEDSYLEDSKTLWDNEIGELSRLRKFREERLFSKSSVTSTAVTGISGEDEFVGTCSKITEFKQIVGKGQPTEEMKAYSEKKNENAMQQRNFEIKRMELELNRNFEDKTVGLKGNFESRAKSSFPNKTEKSKAKSSCKKFVSVEAKLTKKMHQMKFNR